MSQKIVSVHFWNIPKICTYNKRLTFVKPITTLSLHLICEIDWSKFKYLTSYKSNVYSMKYHTLQSLNSQSQSRHRKMRQFWPLDFKGHLHKKLSGLKSLKHKLQHYLSLSKYQKHDIVQVQPWKWWKLKMSQLFLEKLKILRFFYMFSFWWFLQSWRR